jgi:hypothetical protein
MRKVIETQIELEKRRRSSDGQLVINDTPDKSSWNESPDTSDNPKVLPANIEMRSLSTLPVCKCACLTIQATRQATASASRFTNRQTATHTQCRLANKEVELHSRADHKNK